MSSLFSVASILSVPTSSTHLSVNPLPGLSPGPGLIALDSPVSLQPVTDVVAAALVRAHDLVTALGLDPDSGLAWSAAIALLVVAIRVLLLPLVGHGVRSAHAAARARPELLELTSRFSGRTDLESLRAANQERRRINNQHGVSRLGCLPALLQVPVLIALYRVLSDVAANRPVGAMTVPLVASADSASMLGVTISDRWLHALSISPEAGLLVTMLCLLAAALTYLTQRFFVLPTTNPDGMPAGFADVSRLMPGLSAVGVLVGAGAVPVGILVYWVVTNAWSLAQQAAIWRWAPTPGSPAHAARLAARAARPG